ncbi:MAG: hypothetical protein ABIK96_05710 [bacterium]
MHLRKPNGRRWRRDPRKAFLLAGLFLALVGGRPATAADRPHYHDIPARRWDVRDLPGSGEVPGREAERSREYDRRWRIVHDLVGDAHVSRKGQDILRGRGLGPALLDGRTLAEGDKAVDGQDTLRVLIVRISFTTNRDSLLTTIAPDGDFDFSVPEDPGFLVIDPPPHDKAFYEAHLQGLSEYYRFQSGGRLHIEGRVLPEDPRGSYKLTDVADYGPGANGFWTLESLERLVRDMITAADQGTLADGSARLADYDDDDPFTYIIFVHAGSDWQSDINGDSPNDIPTFFVTLGEPQPLTSTDSETALAGSLRECSIIPETTNQDGFPGSIAAAFYHEFGHALGLVDVYNTGTATPNAGIWDLMDSGTNLSVTLGDVTAEGDTVFVVATGVLPPSLGAWNKWFLGWLEMGEIKGNQGEYRLPAVGVPRDQYVGGSNPIYGSAYGDFNLRYPQAYRAGLSTREWFLLENRWVPLDPGETPFLNLSFERDEATGVILYLAGERPAGFWQNSGLYDYFMPAGGMLVWHVDDDRIEAGLDDNTINVDGNGLYLVEADGIRDIGVLDSYVLGWFGSERDPFGAYDPLGNEVGNTELYVDGMPGSRLNDRSYSGLSITNVGPNARDLHSVLRFGAAIDPILASFPWTAPSRDEDGETGARALMGASLVPVDLAGAPALIFADAPGAAAGEPSPQTHLFALNEGGFPFWPAQAGLPAGAFLQAGGPLAGPPALGEDAQGRLVLAWATRAGTVALTHLDADGTLPTNLWERTFAGGIAEQPVFLRAGGIPSLLVPVGADSLVALDPGDPMAAPVVFTGHAWAGPILPINRGDDQSAAAFMDDGVFLLTAGDSPGQWQSWFYPYQWSSGAEEVRGAVVVSAQGIAVFAFDSEGILGSWVFSDPSALPVPGPELRLDGGPVCEPAVADLDGDGRNDLVVATARKIHAYSFEGTPLKGWPVTLFDLFPLADSTLVAGPLIVADGTGDGLNEVYFNTDGGHLVGLGATGRLLDRLPLRWGDRSVAGLAVGPGPDGGRILWLASGGGYAGPPMDRQLVNGRISAYGLASSGQGGATSEWVGARGGPQRGGPEGEPALVSGSSTAVAEVDAAVLYPNPLAGTELFVRFYNHTDRAARFWVHNLEGEVAMQATIPATGGVVNDFRLELPDLASGLYVCRLEHETTTGRRVRTMTLAVEK